MGCRYMAESNGFARSAFEHSSPLLCIVQIKCNPLYWISLVLKLCPTVKAGCSFLVSLYTVDPGVFRICCLPNSISSHCLALDQPRTQSKAQPQAQGRVSTPPLTLTAKPSGLHPSSLSSILLYSSSFFYLLFLSLSASPINAFLSPLST